MAAEFVPPGWNEAEVLAGLHTAMGFGTPTRTEDRATFYLPTTTTNDPTPEDESGVPFDPTVKRAASVEPLAVPCAVEFYDAAGIIEQFGTTLPTRIKITLLDAEYQQVKEFRYVVAGGDKYMRSKTEPPVAMGSFDVWTVWAKAEYER